MLGLPGTTFGDELELLDLNSKIAPDFAWTSIFQPYLGTSLGDYCKTEGLYDGDNDDLSPDFFSATKLNFPKDRKRATTLLQNIFATCVKFPDGESLARNFIEKNERHGWKEWYQTVKEHMYKDIYGIGGE